MKKVVVFVMIGVIALLVVLGLDMQDPAYLKVAGYLCAVVLGFLLGEFADSFEVK